MSIPTRDATARTPGLKGRGTFLIVGLVRNVERQLRADVARLQAAFADADGVSWLIVESDSSDGTIRALVDLQSEVPGFDFISLGALRDRIPLRTARIAHCRNVYLEQLRNNPRYADIDYVVVSDFDGVNDRLTANALASCWLREDWDACSANQDGPYYDLWALRHPEWSPNDCFEQYRFQRSRGQAAWKAYFASVYARMIRIRPQADWVEVDSAFGGLAIYRHHVIVRSSYVGLTADGRELCEHVPLHLGLRAEGYRLFINPRMVAGRAPHPMRARMMLLGLMSFGERGIGWLRGTFSQIRVTRAAFQRSR